MSVDPLAPEYPWYTPYQFAGNDVIRNIDLDGLEPSNMVDPESGQDSGNSLYNSTNTSKATGASGVTGATKTSSTGATPLVGSGGSTGDKSNKVEATSNFTDLVSTTQTLQTPKEIIFEKRSSYLDFYQVSSRLDYQNNAFDQKLININFASEVSIASDGVSTAPQLPDVNINVGPTRLNINPNGEGSITGSLALSKNYRVFYGIDGNLVSTLSTQYRSDSQLAIRMDHSYRPGLITQASFLFVAFGAAGYVAPAASAVSPAIPILLSK